MAPRMVSSASLLALVLALGSAACGDDGEDTGPTATSPATTTGAATTNPGRDCQAVAADALKLNLDYARDVRGIAGADEAEYDRRARALRDEAQALDCPVPRVVEELLRS